MAGGVTFTEGAARRIGRAVREVERRAAAPLNLAGPSGGGSVYVPAWWRIASVSVAGNAGKYVVRKQALNPTTLVLADVEDTRDPDYQKDRYAWTPGIGCASWRVGEVCRGELFYNVNQLGTGPGWGVVLDVAKTFAVTLTQTGGSGGSASAAASWTYTVAELITGRTLATGATPAAGMRPTVGYVKAATYGVVGCSSDGNLIIVSCNEIPEQEACSA